MSMLEVIILMWASAVSGYLVGSIVETIKIRNYQKTEENELILSLKAEMAQLKGLVDFYEGKA